MLLSEINSRRFARLLRNNAAWLGFIALVFIAVNGFSSIDRVRSYHFNWLDLFMTYGLTFFLGLLEAFAASLALAGLELGLEAALRRDLERIFRALLVLGLAAAWVSALLAIFGI